MAKTDYSVKARQVRSGIPQLMSLVATQPGLLLWGLPLLVLNRVSGLAIPYAPKLLVTLVTTRRPTHSLLSVICLISMAVIVQGTSSYMLGQLFSTASHRFIALMRCKVQAHISRLPVTYFDGSKTGALVSRVMTDVEGLRSLIGVGFVEFAGSILTALFVTYLLLHISVTLTAIACAFLASYALCWKWALRRLRPLLGARGALTSEVTGRLMESISGIRVVKGYRAEVREEAVFAKGAHALMENLIRSVRITSLLSLSSTLDLGFLNLAVLVFGCRLIGLGKMSVADLFSYMLFMGYVSAPIMQLTTLGPNVIESLAALDRTREVLSQHQEDDTPARTTQLVDIRGAVQFCNVDFEYEIGKPTLTQINFEAKPGMITALVGSSGAGKSSIVGLVAAFYRPTRGTIFVDGVDLETVTLESFRPALGMVLQESFLFAGSIWDNVTFARPQATDEEVLRACRIAHVDEFVYHLPAGYGTLIGERGVKLSGGQRQRVSIARAIIADPKILVLHEATSSLDSESEALVQEGLAYLMRGRTTFVIAHRLCTVRDADQILVIERGRIIEHGTHRSLLGLQGRYASLHAKQNDSSDAMFATAASCGDA